jgi:hypothetical protein
LVAATSVLIWLKEYFSLHLNNEGNILITINDPRSFSAFNQKSYFGHIAERKAIFNLA